MTSAIARAESRDPATGSAGRRPGAAHSDSAGQTAAGGHRPVRALADAVGVAVGDEAALEERLDDVAQRVVDHPIAKGRGADLAPFRLVDGKVHVGAGAVGLGCNRPAAPPGGRRPGAQSAPRWPRRVCRWRPCDRPATGYPIRTMETYMDDMVIFTRTYDLLHWLLPAASSSLRRSVLSSPSGCRTRLSIFRRRSSWPTRTTDARQAHLRTPTLT